MDLVRRFGSSLYRMGLRKGDVVGLVLPNIPEFPIVLLGAAGVGMPVTTVNPIYTAEEIARQMQNSGAKAIVTVPLLADTIRQVATLCPSIQCIIGVGESADGFVSLNELFEDSGEYFNENLEVLETDCFSVETILTLCSF